MIVFEDFVDSVVGDVVFIDVVKVVELVDGVDLVDVVELVNGVDLIDGVDLVDVVDLDDVTLVDDDALKSSVTLSFFVSILNPTWFCAKGVPWLMLPDLAFLPPTSGNFRLPGISPIFGCGSFSIFGSGALPMLASGCKSLSVSMLTNSIRNVNNFSKYYYYHENPMFGIGTFCIT